MIQKGKWEILKKLEFKSPPVGIKYLTKPIREIAKLGEAQSLCEMLRTAFNGNSFYADAGNHSCDAGLYVLGQTELAEQYLNGEFGSAMGVYRDARAAARLYHYIPRIKKGR